MKTTRIVAVALLAALFMWSETTAAEIITAGVEGWHTWQTDEPGAVTEMCCFTRDRRAQSRTGCNLDGSRVSYGNGGDCYAEPGHVQVYALMKNGNLTRIRVLSSECSVSTETQLTDHGVVSTDKNIEWFRKVIENERTSQDVREEALFGLVQSKSDAAFEYIDQLLSRH